MNKKRVTLKEWSYIGRYNHAAKWCRPFCTYTLYSKDEYTIIREQRVHLLAYLILFIPLHVLQVFILMWDGGLKEFEIFKRMLGKDILTVNSDAYVRAKAVLENTDK